jgi:hypothetical protein
MTKVVVSANKGTSNAVILVVSINKGSFAFVDQFCKSNCPSKSPHWYGQGVLMNPKARLQPSTFALIQSCWHQQHVSSSEDLSSSFCDNRCWHRRGVICSLVVILPLESTRAL